ncbi:MAG: C40 family peptidase [Candidatus Goldbacteria bacterium]|nr:C40 family peptidase [Candidatus Goldiibacteriota bacterium]
MKIFMLLFTLCCTFIMADDNYADVTPDRDDYIEIEAINKYTDRDDLNDDWILINQEDKITSTQGEKIREKISTDAKKLLGVPYVTGGISPDTGFDCSGFVFYVYQKNSIEIPRLSYMQFQEGLPIEQYELKMGDLVFFEVYDKDIPILGDLRNVIAEYYKTGKPGHVGIYLGNGKFIHAPKKGDVVKISSIHDNFWKKHYLSARRYVNVK